MIQNSHYRLLPAAILLAGSCTLSGLAFAQEDQSNQQQTYRFSTGLKEKSTDQHIEISEQNGEKFVIIETTQDGETTREEYRGEEAEKYLEENQRFSWSVGGSGSNVMIVRAEDLSDIEDVDTQIETIIEELKSDLDANGTTNRVIVKEIHSTGGDMDFRVESLTEDHESSVWVVQPSSSKRIIRINDSEEATDLEEVSKLLEELNIELDLEELIDQQTDGSQTMVITKTIHLEQKDEEAATSNSERPRKKSAFKRIATYPNPTSDEVSFEIDLARKGQVTVLLQDLNGRVVTSQTMEGKGLLQGQFNLSGQPEGVYLIEFKQGDTVETKRIIVAR